MPLISRQAAFFIRTHYSSAFVLGDDSEDARGTPSEPSSTQRENYTMISVMHAYPSVA